MSKQFNRSLVTLLSGSVLGQAIPIAIMPILTRVYSPEDFGLLALYVAITLTIGSIANGRYELAIMLPKKDSDAINIAALGIFIASVLSIFLFLIFIFFGDFIAKELGNAHIKYWLYLAPVSVFFIGVFNSLNYLCTRRSAYKSIAKSNIIRASSLSLSQLAFGVFSKLFNGLILGQFIGTLLVNFNLAKKVKSDYKSTNIQYLRMLALAKRYKKFPMFSMWAILANNLATHLNNILISTFYSLSTLGFYSLAQKILGLPTSVIGNSIGQVYFQQASEEKKQFGHARTTYKSTIKKLILLSIVFFFPLYFTIEYIFYYAFGSGWVIAGTYAKILIPFFAFRFIAVSLSTTNSLFEKQHYSLVWQIILLLTNIFVVNICNYLNLNFEFLIEMISLFNSILYFSLILITMKVSKG